MNTSKWRPWPWLICIALAAMTLYAGPAFADIPPAGLLDKVLGDYTTAAAAWKTQIITPAIYLFWSLATISMVWTFGTMAMRKADLGEFFSEFVRFTITTGFFWWLLQNGPAMAMDIINGLRMVGSNAAGASPGGDPGALLTPSKLMDTAFHIVDKALSSMSWLHPVDGLGVVIAVIFILVCLSIVAANVLLALISAYTLVYAGLFILGFGGCRWTSEMAIGYYKTMISIGVELMTMTLLLGVATSTLDQFYGDMNPSSMRDILAVLGVCVVLAMLIGKLPSRVAGMVGGGTGSAGVGAAGGTMMAAAALGAAASSGAKTLAGAAKGLAGGAQAVMAAAKKAIASEGGGGAGAMLNAIGGKGGGGAGPGTSLAAAMGGDSGGGGGSMGGGGGGKAGGAAGAGSGGKSGTASGSSSGGGSTSAGDSEAGEGSGGGAESGGEPGQGSNESASGGNAGTSAESDRVGPMAEGPKDSGGQASSGAGKAAGIAASTVSMLAQTLSGDADGAIERLARAAGAGAKGKKRSGAKKARGGKGGAGRGGSNAGIGGGGGSQGGGESGAESESAQGEADSAKGGAEPGGQSSDAASGAASESADAGAQTASADAGGEAERLTPASFALATGKKRSNSKLAKAGRIATNTVKILARGMQDVASQRLENTMGGQVAKAIRASANDVDAQAEVAAFRDRT